MRTTAPLASVTVASEGKHADSPSSSLSSAVGVGVGDSSSESVSESFRGRLVAGVASAVVLLPPSASPPAPPVEMVDTSDLPKSICPHDRAVWRWSCPSAASGFPTDQMAPLTPSAASPAGRAAVQKRVRSVGDVRWAAMLVSPAAAAVAASSRVTDEALLPPSR